MSEEITVKTGWEVDGMAQRTKKGTKDKESSADDT
jgi:hypothetical protein